MRPSAHLSPEDRRATLAAARPPQLPSARPAWSLSQERPGLAELPDLLDLQLAWLSPPSRPGSPPLSAQARPPASETPLPEPHLESHSPRPAPARPSSQALPAKL